MNEPQKYRKKPVVIEAMQWTVNNTADVQAFTGRDIPVGTIYEGDANAGELSGFDTYEYFGTTRGRLWVRSNACWIDVRGDSWIVRDASGYYPCLPERFAETYEPATSGVDPW